MVTARLFSDTNKILDILLDALARFHHR